ncbi:MAG: glucokinase [Methyloceanibacter sp.]
MSRGRQQPARALVADIGGTNARFALACLETLDLTQTRQFLCSDYPTLASAACAYLQGLKEPPRHGALAVAAPVVDEEVSVTNSPWSATGVELRRATGLDHLLLLNDFEALALSLPYLRGEELHQIGGAEPAPHATRLVLGPGTGIGVAGLVWSGSGWVAVPGEGGHMSFAAQSPREVELTMRLRSGREHLSVERVLSGPGLAGLYGAIAASHGKPAEPLPTSEVLTRALAGDDGIAVETLETFVTWLGRFAGDAALVFGARGGVYLGGGIAPRMLQALSTGAFRQAFEAKGRMRSLLAPIPVKVILAEFATLKGAAAALRARLARGDEPAPALT